MAENFNFVFVEKFEEDVMDPVGGEYATANRNDAPQPGTDEEVETDYNTRRKYVRGGGTIDVEELRDHCLYLRYDISTTR